MNRTRISLICLASVLLLACSGCGDRKLRGRIAALDDNALFEIQDDYPRQGKVGQFIAEEIQRRGISKKPLRSEPETKTSLRAEKHITPAPTKPLIPYTVINREEVSHYKVAFDVQVKPIDGKLPSTEQLAAVSKHLKAQEKPHDRTFVSFLLPGMRSDTGSFASAHHNPEMEVKLYPSNIPDQYAKLLMQDKQRTEKEEPTSASDKVLGRWIQKAPFPAVVTFRDMNGSVFMTQLFDDGSKGNYEMVGRKVGSQTRYSQKDSKTSDYFSITPRFMGSSLDNREMAIAGAALAGSDRESRK